VSILKLGKIITSNSKLEVFFHQFQDVGNSNSNFWIKYKSSKIKLHLSKYEVVRHSKSADPSPPLLVLIVITEPWDWLETYSSRVALE
jgi:hypothetical protein